MKLIGKFLSKKRFEPRSGIDEKTVSFLFEKAIREEYGRKGSASIKVDFYKDGKIFVKTASSNWANELWLNKDEIVKKINKKLGGAEIKDIKI